MAQGLLELLSAGTERREYQMAEPDLSVRAASLANPWAQRSNFSKESCVPIRMRVPFIVAVPLIRFIERPFVDVS